MKKKKPTKTEIQKKKKRRKQEVERQAAYKRQKYLWSKGIGLYEYYEEECDKSD